MYMAVEVESRDEQESSFVFLDSSGKWTYLARLGSMNSYEAQFNLMRTPVLCEFVLPTMGHPQKRLDWSAFLSDSSVIPL